MKNVHCFADCFFIFTNVTDELDGCHRIRVGGELLSVSALPSLVSVSARR